MRKIKLNKEKLSELEKFGWKYDLMEGGYIAANGASIAIDNRCPYNNTLLKFSLDENRHQENIKWLKDNDFIEEEL